MALTTERIPDGMTVAIENEQTTGQVTTATFRLRANSTARQGTFRLGLRGRAERVRDATLQMSITIAAPLAYVLSVSTTSLTIAKGGIARANNGDRANQLRGRRSPLPALWARAKASDTRWPT